MCSQNERIEETNELKLIVVGELMCNLSSKYTYRTEQCKGFSKNKILTVVDTSVLLLQIDQPQLKEIHQNCNERQMEKSVITMKKV